MARGLTAKTIGILKSHIIDHYEEYIGTLLFMPRAIEVAEQRISCDAYTNFFYKFPSCLHYSFFSVVPK